MRAEPVDPRDVSHQVDRPTYRVYFWSPERTAGRGAAWTSDEWRLTSAADVHEVLEWAAAQARGRRAELSVEVGPHADRELVRLAGTDPTGVRRREARPGEAGEVADLWLRARRAATPVVPPPVHTDEEVRAWFGEVVFPQQEVWVAEAESGGLVGLLVLDDGWVEQLYVEPALTGWGIGALLLDRAKQRRPDGLELWTFEANAGARRFYEREGFRAVERAVGHSEEGAPDVRYHWSG